MSEDQISALTKAKDEQINKLNAMKDVLKTKLADSKKEIEELKKKVELLESKPSKQEQVMEQVKQAVLPEIDYDLIISKISIEMSNLIEDSKSEIISKVGEMISNINIPTIKEEQGSSKPTPKISRPSDILKMQKQEQSKNNDSKLKSDFPSPSERLKIEKQEQEEYEKSKPKPKSEFPSPSERLKKQQEQEENVEEETESSIPTISRPSGPYKCPKCKSLEVKEELDKTQIIGFGMFGKKYYCKKCRAEWKYND